MSPTQVLQNFSTLVLEGLFICLLTHLEGNLLSTLIVPPASSIIHPSMSDPTDGVPSVSNVDPLLVPISIYGTP